MSTAEARRVSRSRQVYRRQAKNLCRCGKPMDRIGTRCRRCTDRHARICRPRHRRNGYGDTWTVNLMQFGQALAARGMQ